MRIGVSQNGWPVYDNTDHFVQFRVEGVNFWAANEDVAYVMQDFIQKYNDRIESITLPVRETPGRDDWSYAVRAVRGQTEGYSNHGSATANDTNATRHPRGVHNTYSPTKRKELRQLVDEYEGVLRHGEFYNSTVDGMHVEINDGITATRVKALADKLRARNTVKENEVELTTTVTLSDAQANAMNLNITDPAKKFKKGQTVKVDRLLVWGGPGIDRIYAKVRASEARELAMATQLKALTAAVTALAANSPAGIEAAFKAGIADLKTQVDNLDLKLTIDTDGE